METNYYRVPTAEEMNRRKAQLKKAVKEMDISPSEISRGFRMPVPEVQWDTLSPWDIFIENTLVHVGKRSGGWVFAWDHNDWKHFGKSREELFSFIRSGRVVDEYGEEMDPEEFIKMALEWCPDGMTNPKYYEQMKNEGKYVGSPESYNDIIVEDLRFMNFTDFS